MADTVVKMGNASIDAAQEPILSMSKTDFKKHFAGKISGVEIDDVWKEVQKKKPRKTQTKKAKSEEKE